MCALKHYNDEGIRFLAVAVLERAMADYRQVCQKMRDSDGTEDTPYMLTYDERDAETVRSLEAFFRGGWCDLLCWDMTSEYLYRRILSERARIMAKPKNARERYRHNVIMNYDGEELTMSEIAEKREIPLHTLANRLRRGWTTEQAIETPYKPFTVAKFEYQGRMLTIRELSDETGIASETLRWRICRKKWPIERALADAKTNTNKRKKGD